jgi:tetratricopeptide (TPR) repeat protein
VRLAVYLAAIFIGLPTAAAAQKDAFRDALIAFHSKLAGDYGDEGPIVANSLTAMSTTLATWDAAIRDAEQHSRRRLPDAAALEQRRIHSELADLYLERGRYADAIRELDAAIRADSSRGTLHVLRGLALEEVGRSQDAAGAFRRAWETDRDDPVSAYLVASRRSTQGNSDEIAPQVGSLLKALERRLQSVRPDVHVALFPEFALVPDSAAVTPVFSPARYAEGFTLALQGRYTDAVASFARAIDGDPLVTDRLTQSTSVRQAIALLRKGEAENAIPMLEAAAAASPRSSEIHRILGGAYADLDDNATSLAHLETAAALAPDDERATVALGRALEHAGQSQRAERVLQSTTARLPQSADAHSALADLYETTRGRDALHELEVTTSVTVFAGKGALYLRLADLQHRHLEYERVVGPLTRRVRLNPNDARAHTDLGLALTRVGRLTDALIELVTASLLGPDDADALTAIGQIQFDEGRYAAAETVLQRAVAKAPALVQARYLLGQTLARVGRPDEGKTQLAEFDRLRAAANSTLRESFELDQLRQQADRDTKAGRHDEATAAWQEIVAREPKPENHVALARALLAAGRPTAALEHLRAAADVDAGADVYRQLAEIYTSLGRAAESAAALLKYQRLIQEQRRGEAR